MLSFRRLLLIIALLLGFGAMRPVWAEDPATPAGALPARVQIRNVAFDRLLRPQDANGADGTPLVLYPAEPWRCMTWNAQTNPAGTVSLKNVFTSKTFATAAKDGTIRQVPFQADKVWTFDRLASGEYRILDPATGKALTARDEDTLAFDDWKDAANQKWQVTAAPAHLTM